MSQARPSWTRAAPFAIACLVLAGSSATTLSAQTWWQERERLQNETAAIVERLRREPGNTSFADQMRRAAKEYLEKVTKPQLEAATTCEDRNTAITDALAFLQQLDVMGIDIPGAAALYAEVAAGAYAGESYERCMNEMYRRCVLEDDARYVRTMVNWTIGWERMKLLLRGSPSERQLLSGELDPRITKCRGPWYQVRITVERKGEEDGLGPWYQRDVSTGWLGRGLSLDASGVEDRKHPAGFDRRAEALGHGAACPDGGCGESCSFVHVRTGPARVTYELESRFVDDFREFSVGFVEGRMAERFERNGCGHTDVPDPHYPGDGFAARLPGRFPPLPDPDEASDPSPALTDQLDEWPRLFRAGGTELLIWNEPIGRLEVLAVCDGQEIWGKGSSACQEKWEEYLVYFGDEIPGVLGPGAPGAGTRK